MYQYPKGLILPEGQRAPGSLVSRVAASGGGGGGGGGPAGDVLGFTGPQTFTDSGDGFVSDFQGNLGTRPWTFEFDLVYTGGITQTVWSQWVTGRRSFQLLIQNGVNHILQGTQNGTTTVNVQIDTSVYAQDVRVNYRLERAGDTFTLTDLSDDTVLDTEVETGFDFFDAGADPHIIGESFQGTIYSASLVFND